MMTGDGPMGAPGPGGLFSVAEVRRVPMATGRTPGRLVAEPAVAGRSP